jgi:hypothetical protein
MSVSLLEVLEQAGFDIKNNLDDARWLLAQKDEFEEICDMADLLESSYDEYKDFIDLQEDLGNFDNPSWEEWREEHGNQ